MFRRCSSSSTVHADETESLLYLYKLTYRRNNDVASKGRLGNANDLGIKQGCEGAGRAEPQKGIGSSPGRTARRHDMHTDLEASTRISHACFFPGEKRRREEDERNLALVHLPFLVNDFFFSVGV